MPNLAKPNGLSDFHKVLAEFRRLALWAAPSAAVPFVADLVSLAPPWPKAIVVLTAIAQLGAIMLVYQVHRTARRKTITRLMKVSAVVLAAATTIYLVGDSLFTYQTPVSGARWVKGFICNADALLVFPDKCPWLDRPELETANWDAERLWSLWSLAVMRVGLVVLWIIAFLALSTFIASFVVYQRRAAA